MLVPVNNQALIEIVAEYGNLTASGQDEQIGIVRAINFTNIHLTASTGFEMKYEPVAFTEPNQAQGKQFIMDLVGKTVRYALFADSDSAQFPIDGKPHVLIPWYRILGVEDDK